MVYTLGIYIYRGKRNLGRTKVLWVLKFGEVLLFLLLLLPLLLLVLPTYLPTYLARVLRNFFRNQHDQESSVLINQ